jgi:hypothetical protein
MASRALSKVVKETNVVIKVMRYKREGKNNGDR